MAMAFAPENSPSVPASADSVKLPSSTPRVVLAGALLVLGAHATTGDRQQLLYGLSAMLAGMAVLVYGLFKEATTEAMARAIAPDAGSGAVPAALQRLNDQLADAQRKFDADHPATGLPLRDRFAAQIAPDMTPASPPRNLGVIRFSEYSRMAAFDAKGADSMLSLLGQRLRAAATGVGRIGHIDDDCYGVWFSPHADVTAATALLDDIVRAMSQEVANGTAVFHPSLEHGLLRYPADGADAKSLFIKANGVLFRANGRRAGDTPASRTPASLSQAREQFALEQDLTKALAEDQIDVVYQPIIDVDARRISGAEALLRWNRPGHGAVSPERFFPLIESLGLSERYSLWVLNRVCEEARRWREAGHENIRVAVNLSARQLAARSLRSEIERILKLNRLPASSLELELTETAMVDGPKTLSLFRELQALGVAVAIDDFGSGYSSLSYLKNLPFDKLKIDREFVAGVHERLDSRAICTALLELGRGLNLEVLAEGVETAEEVAALRGLGCRLFQGFYFSEPLSGPVFTALLGAQDDVVKKSDLADA